jgi:hypothetical protein
MTTATVHDRILTLIGLLPVPRCLAFAQWCAANAADAAAEADECATHVDDAYAAAAYAAEAANAANDAASAAETYAATDDATYAVAVAVAAAEAAEAAIIAAEYVGNKRSVTEIEQLDFLTEHS